MGGREKRRQDRKSIGYYSASGGYIQPRLFFLEIWPYFTSKPFQIFTLNRKGIFISLFDWRAGLIFARNYQYSRKFIQLISSLIIRALNYLCHVRGCPRLIHFQRRRFRSEFSFFFLPSALIFLFVEKTTPGFNKNMRPLLFLHFFTLFAIQSSYVCIRVPSVPRWVHQGTDTDLRVTEYHK